MLARRAPGLAWIPKFARDRLTPAALGAVVTALAISIGYVLNAQRDLHQLKDAVAEQGKQLELLHSIDTQLAVMIGKVDSIAGEVDRQRAWRDRIEEAAEAGPHARRKP